MGKNYKLGVAAMASTILLSGCDTESLLEDIVGDDGEEFSSSALYLKDSSGTGVADISYSCEGGYTDEGNLISSGTTSITGDMSISYWPGYDLMCTITPNDAPALYLYDANGPINDANVHCSTSSYGLTGDDGSINNASTDTCYINLTIN